MTAETMIACGQCGMPCRPAEYHPYAACLMYMACHDGNTVRDNLDAVKADGYQAAYDENPPVRQEDVR